MIVNVLKSNEILTFGFNKDNIKKFQSTLSRSKYMFSWSTFIQYLIWKVAKFWNLFDLRANYTLKPRYSILHRHSYMYIIIWKYFILIGYIHKGLNNINSSQKILNYSILLYIREIIIANIFLKIWSYFSLFWY